MKDEVSSFISIYSISINLNLNIYLLDTISPNKPLIIRLVAKMVEATSSSSNVPAAVQPSVNGSPAHPQPSQNVELLFIVQKKKPVLHALPIQGSQTGATIMHLLAKEVKSIRPAAHWYQTRVVLEDAIVSRVSYSKSTSHFPFVNPPLSSANSSQSCIGDPEAQDYPRAVIIEKSTPRPDLTDAFHNPSALRGSDFLRLHSQFIIVPSTGGNNYRHAILIKAGTNKYLVAGAFALVILSSLVVGVLVGYFLHNTGYGLGAWAGIMATFALIQGFLFGMKFLG
ncbi:hypothetical protein G7Y89_g13043 [Cudoniella acicularis]|uniref:Uncharacterized protein n=1 Tax=Cudoniella acicularis TaxID=354080 RepID=A0A8H4R9A0_9HELO|nr:hypothetical protein G7Y89_g13043 [Cudoniella acicularis]